MLTARTCCSWDRSQLYLTRRFTLLPTVVGLSVGAWVEGRSGAQRLAALQPLQTVGSVSQAPPGITDAHPSWARASPGPLGPISSGFLFFVQTSPLSLLNLPSSPFSFSITSPVHYSTNHSDVGRRNRNPVAKPRSNLVPPLTRCLSSSPLRTSAPHLQSRRQAVLSRLCEVHAQHPVSAQCAGQKP